MRLTFWGAARQVTGSMYLLSLDSGYNVLIDCGLDLEQERKSKDQIKSKTRIDTYEPVFPFEPTQIHLVLLTHAHIDHSGLLPLLIKEGYEGQILCTNPTMYLSHILLKDSALLHERRLKTALSKNRQKKCLSLSTDAMYFQRDVASAVDRMVPIQMNQPFKINDELKVNFVTAGHLLGAAHIVMEVREGARIVKLAFSGDMGRRNYPLLPDPIALPEVDYLVCESTYGNRVHKNSETPRQALRRIIQEVCIEQPGKLIVPAFSVGRTQALLYELQRLFGRGDLPKIKVYTDSLMAFDSSKVYEQFVKNLNKEAREYYQDEDMLFDFDNLEYVSDLKKSRALTQYQESSIIVSSSGMIHGGRIEHHVKQNLQNPKSCIAIIGYCAKGTLGHELMQGRSVVQIKGKELEVRCRVEVLDCFSAHGDQNDLLSFVQNQDPIRLKQVFLTHGEHDSMEAFASLLQSHGFARVEMPTKGQTFILN